MKWVLINRDHINTDQAQSFSWRNGLLCILFAGDLGATTYKDPDKKEYLKLCRMLGIKPREEG